MKYLTQVIMMSSVALACEDPVEADSEWNKKLTYFDYGFTCVFGVEVLLKVLHSLWFCGIVGVGQAI